MSAEAANPSSQHSVETETNTKVEEGTEKYAYHHRRDCSHRSRRRPPQKWW